MAYDPTVRPGSSSGGGGGDYTLPADLSAIDALTGVGVPVRTGSDAWALRSVDAASANKFMRGDGVFAELPQQQVAQSPSGNYLLSGGSVVVISGFNLLVSAATYSIQGQQYTSPQTAKTLSAADPTNPRIDIVAVDSTGAVVVVEGTPGANPSAPTLDPETQMDLTFIYVPAGATDLEVVSTDVYRENTEWTAVSSGASIVVNSSNNPNAGTTCVEATNAAANDYVEFTKPSGYLETGGLENLVLNIRSKAAWASQKSLVIRLYQDTVLQGAAVTVKSGTYGFASGATTAYQQIVIPMSLFKLNGGSVNKVRITVNGGGASIGFYLDDIFFQQGVEQAAAQPADPYDITAAFAGVLENSTKILPSVPVVRPIAFPAGFDGSIAKAGAAATGSSVFSIKKNGVEVGTITFAAAGTTGTFAATDAGPILFARGDLLSITAPAVADATLADVGIVLSGTR